MFVSGIFLVPTYVPSRNTLILSHSSNISSILCEMYTMDTPDLRRDLMTSNSTTVSLWVSAAVGSSMMMTFASTISALQISIICCCPTDRLDMTSPGSILTPRRPSASDAFCRIAFWSQKPNLFLISFPMNRFSSTVRSNSTLSS